MFLTVAILTVSITLTAKASDSLYSISIDVILKGFSPVVLNSFLLKGRGIDNKVLFTLFSINSTIVLL